jgi:hypothetical protein
MAADHNPVLRDFKAGPLDFPRHADQHRHDACLPSSSGRGTTFHEEKRELK